MNSLRSSRILAVVSLVASVVAIILALLSDSVAVFALGGIALVLGVASRAAATSVAAVIVAAAAIGVEVASRLVVIA